MTPGIHHFIFICQSQPTPVTLVDDECTDQASEGGGEGELRAFIVQPGSHINIWIMCVSLAHSV